jgi:hypothetical protein
VTIAPELIFVKANRRLPPYLRGQARGRSATARAGGHRMVRTLLKVLAIAAALVLCIVAPASAQHHGGGHGGHGHGWHGGHGHSHVSLAFGFGWWGWPGYGYYDPPTYYYPPYYAYPPYAYAAPPSYGSSGTVAPTAQSPARECRDYQGDATIDASGAPFYGRACLEADGLWHIVN